MGQYDGIDVEGADVVIVVMDVGNTVGAALVVADGESDGNGVGDPLGAQDNDEDAVGEEEEA